MWSPTEIVHYAVEFTQPEDPSFASVTYVHMPCKREKMMHANGRKWNVFLEHDRTLFKREGSTFGEGFGVKATAELINIELSDPKRSLPHPWIISVYV